MEYGNSGNNLQKLLKEVMYIMQTEESLAPKKFSKNIFFCPTHVMKHSWDSTGIGEQA